MASDPPRGLALVLPPALEERGKHLSLDVHGPPDPGPLRLKHRIRGKRRAARILAEVLGDLSVPNTDLARDLGCDEKVVRLLRSGRVPLHLADILEIQNDRLREALGFAVLDACRRRKAREHR